MLTVLRVNHAKTVNNQRTQSCISLIGVWTVSQGKGDMVTYWLEGKRSAAPAKDARNPVTLQESERDPETHTDDYSSIPGVLSGSDDADLLCDP